MNFPQLNDWELTSKTLHQASMLLGPIHNAVFEPRRNYLHLPMFIEATGLISQRLPQGGLIHVNFKTAEVIYERATAVTERFAFADHTQTTLFEVLLTALKQDELAAFFTDIASDTLASGLMQKLHADGTRVEFLALEDVNHTDSLTLNAQTAGDYADVLYSVFTAVSRFLARHGGHTTPIVVWPEHFDLSTLWFHPENNVLDANKAHLNFGFAPYTPGQYEQPYLYVYAYPYPEPFEAPALPKPAFWNPQGWRGVVVTYADMREQADPTQCVEVICDQVFDILTKYF